MADESLCSLDDGRRLIEERAADIFSIRLGKCGGFSGRSGWSSWRGNRASGFIWAR